MTVFQEIDASTYSQKRGQRVDTDEHAAGTAELAFLDDNWLLEREPEYESLNDRSSTNSIQMYMNTIGQVPLLTAEEETALAQSIVLGRKARSRLENEPYLCWQERAALEHDLARAEDARQRLIQANLRLVVSVARKYSGSSMALMDLIQEGNIGLMRAVEKFDYRRGNRFSTYATWWIRQAITRAIAQQSRLIRLPVHMTETMTHLHRTINQLKQTSEADPTPEDIARAMNISLRKVQRLLKAARQPVSLEQPIGAEGESRLGELLADEQAESPLDIVAQNMLQQDVYAALNELPERERQILKMRYGLVDGSSHTLEEVGVAFGITRERTRQIEAEALRRLRHPQLGLRLREYLGYDA